MAETFWCELKLAVPAAAAELIAEILQEEGAGGIVYDDPDILDQVTLADDEIIGKELQESLPSQYELRSYFPVDDRLGERVGVVKERLQELLGSSPELTITQIREEDWAEAWKTYFKPELIGQVVIKPSWENYQPQGPEIVVELDPGMAFGTGTHPTTRMCVLLLQELVRDSTRMLDIGTGSGILAVTAAKLGANPILASDIDPMAVRIALENARLNGVETQIQAVEGNLLALPIDEPFELVVANIIANAILEIIPGIPRVLQSGGRFLASGIIAERFPEVAEALHRSGFTIEKSLHQDDWVAVIAKR